MIPGILETGDDAATAIWPVAEADYPVWLEIRSEQQRAWLEAAAFKPDQGKFVLLPDADGGLAGVVLGLGTEQSLWAYGGLAMGLPAGAYRLDGPLGPAQANDAALAWALGAYRFDRYRESREGLAELALPADVDRDRLAATVAGSTLARDLINTPAADMGPAELAEAANELAHSHGGHCNVLVGDELLLENYPAVHAVGRASINYPRLIDLTWGDVEQPKVTLVGKGVCFDSGGLDLKSAAGMLKMKKDMGGAATVLGLASMIMSTGLPVRLRVLIPAVENAVSGSAYRPGDVLQTRKGLTVEIGNTDAEGRIVLCDALAEADSEAPDLLLDFATLTGAARVALGPDLPALFSDDEDLAAEFLALGVALEDRLWRLPIHAPYREMLDSKIADLNNVSDGPFAGAVTAALYLRQFVTETGSWAHVDTYGWNDKNRPGRPAGGEALAMRAAYALVQKRLC